MWDSQLWRWLMEKSEKDKGKVILELIRLVDSKYEMRQWYRIANPYFMMLMILMITLVVGRVYVEVYLGIPRDVANDLATVISIFALLLAFLAVFEKEEKSGYVKGNYKRLEREPIVDRSNEPILRSLIIMKTKQPEVSLEQIYSLNEELFNVEKLIEKIYL
jgi:hypothetical protein